MHLMSNSAHNLKIQAALISLLVTSVSSFSAQADTVRVMTWNISGNMASEQDAVVDAAFALADADIILIQEGNNADLGDNLANYSQVIADSGQEIWILKGDRFSAANLNTWEGACNERRSFANVSATIADANSDNDLIIYSVHFCVSDLFNARGPERDPDISNDDQQEAVCNLIADEESHVSEGIVSISGDFNTQRVDDGDSVVAFLEGTGELHPQYCNPTTTDIDMTVGGTSDVQRIMATGGAGIFSNEISQTRQELGFGQHGWVAVDIDLGSGQPTGE